MEMLNPLPPIVGSAVNWLKENIHYNMRVFEYGSGTSTLFFSKNVKRLISIEYLSKRFNQTADALNHFRKMTIATADITHELIEGEERKVSYPYSYESYGTTDKTFQYHSFEKNVKAIKKYHNIDMVLINGRSRSSCIKEAVGKIKKGGYLILNNSLREEYQNAADVFLSKFPRKDFQHENDQTSIWTIKDEL